MNQWIGGTAIADFSQCVDCCSTNTAISVVESSYQEVDRAWANSYQCIRSSLTQFTGWVVERGDHGLDRSRVTHGSEGSGGCLAHGAISTTERGDQGLDRSRVTHGSEGSGGCLAHGAI